MQQIKSEIETFRKNPKEYFESRISINKLSEILYSLEVHFNSKFDGIKIRMNNLECATAFVSCKENKEELSEVFELLSSLFMTFLKTKDQQVFSTKECQKYGTNFIHVFSLDTSKYDYVSRYMKYHEELKTLKEKSELGEATKRRKLDEIRAEELHGIKVEQESDEVLNNINHEINILKIKIEKLEMLRKPRVEFYRKKKDLIHTNFYKNLNAPMMDEKKLYRRLKQELNLKYGLDK